MRKPPVQFDTATAMAYVADAVPADKISGAMGLYVAGTAMDAPRNAISQSWGSGWGVRLLNRLVAQFYER